MSFKRDPYAKKKRIPMTVDINASGTVMVGVYSNDQKATVIGHVRMRNGILERDVTTIHHKNVIAALAIALNDLHELRANDIAIFTESIAVLKFLTPPIRIPQKRSKKLITEIEHIQFRKKKEFAEHILICPVHHHVIFRLMSYRNWICKKYRTKEVEKVWAQHWHTNESMTQPELMIIDNG